MDFSTGISVAALVLVMPLGIATNLLTPKVVAYLERRKLIKTTRTKEQALRAYRQVKEFRNGTSDKYAYYILMAALSVCLMLGACTLILIILLYFPKYPLDVLIGGPVLPILTVLAFGCFALGIATLTTIPQTERQLKQFDEYTAEVKAKWGQDVI